MTAAASPFWAYTDDVDTGRWFGLRTTFPDGSPFKNRPACLATIIVAADRIDVSVATDEGAEDASGVELLLGLDRSEATWLAARLAESAALMDALNTAGDALDGGAP